MIFSDDKAKGFFARSRITYCYYLAVPNHHEWLIIYYDKNI